MSAATGEELRHLADVVREKRQTLDARKADVDAAQAALDRAREDMKVADVEYNDAKGDMWDAAVRT